MATTTKSGRFSAEEKDAMRERAHDLLPRTWYGMPAYATPGRDGR